jgi:hypothetical protein
MKTNTVAFWKDFAKPFWEQVMLGLIIAVAILFFQIRYGVIKTAEQKGNEFALLWPYLGLIGGFVLVHLVRAPWKLDKEHLQKHEDHSRHLAAAHAQVQEEIGKRGRPEVVPICEWKRDEHGQIESNVRAFRLKTLTDVAALNVKINDIELENGTADFRSIPLLPGKSDDRPYCKIVRNKKSTTEAMWDLYTLVKYSCVMTGSKMSEIEIPIVVDYLDSHGTKHQSTSVLRYDWFLGVGRVEDTTFRRIV